MPAERRKRTPPPPPGPLAPLARLLLDLAARRRRERERRATAVPADQSSPEPSAGDRGEDDPPAVTGDRVANFASDRCPRRRGGRGHEPHRDRGQAAS
jgi:hypothetical protein